jgi:hypothetical protein
MRNATALAGPDARGAALISEAALAEAAGGGRRDQAACGVRHQPEFATDSGAADEREPFFR